MEVNNAGAGKFRRGARVKDCEPHAIESHQSVKSAKPQIAIRGLYHCRGGVFREAVFGFPVVEKEIPDSTSRGGVPDRGGGAIQNEQASTPAQGRSRPKGDWLFPRWAAISRSALALIS